MNKTYKNAHGFRWRLIYYLDASDGEIFSSESQAKNCNLKNKFSILSNIPKIKGQTTYTFLLEYPIEYPNKFILWQQSLSPYDDIEQSGVNSAQGFVSLRNTIGTFNGLVRTTLKTCCKPTLIDGSPGIGSWFYSIGMYSKCDWQKVPGPNAAVKITSLWVRTTDNDTIKGICSNQSKSHIFLYLLILLLSR